MSKWLLIGLLATAAVALWRWRTRLPQRGQQPMQPPPSPTSVMVTCCVCGAHVDARLTVSGPQGPLCREHRHSQDLS